MERTPLVARLPRALVSTVKPPRTPVIDGTIARPLSDLVQQHDEVTHADLTASLKRNAVSPQDDPLWEQTSEYLCQASLAYFFAEMISGPIDHPYNGKSLVGRHHEEWDRIVAENDRVLIEAARDHGKSHFFSLAYPIWMAGYVKPGSLGYIFSSTQDTANALLALVKEELLNNPKFEHLVPATRDRLWSKKEIRLRSGSVIRARGMGVKVRGGHPDWIVVDDGLTDEDIYSETIRRRTIDYFLSAIVNMVKPGGQLIVVGTPMHFGDLYGHLKETGQYHCSKYPAINAKGEILFPERYDRKRLENRKHEVGPARFAREFLCQPLTDESSLFPSHLFSGGDVRLPYKLGLPAAYWEKLGWPRYTGVDFAMSASASADWTVIFTVAVDQQGNRWIVNLQRVKGAGFQAQLDMIKEEYARFLPDVIHAEANQMQRIFSDEIIRETDLPIRKFFTSGVQPKQPWRHGMTSLTMGKHSIDRGVPSLRMSLENRKWRFPRGDAHSIELVDVWFGEMMAMGWVNGQVSSVGDHDDTVMASWMVDAAIRLGSFSFSFGEDSIEGTPELEEETLPPELRATPGTTLPEAAEDAEDDVAEPIQPAPPEPEEHDMFPSEGAPRPADLGFGGHSGGFGGNFGF